MKMKTEDKVVKWSMFLASLIIMIILLANSKYNHPALSFKYAAWAGLGGAIVGGILGKLVVIFLRKEHDTEQS